MTPEQKAEALRLADELWMPVDSWRFGPAHQAAVLLRTLAAEPQGEPVASDTAKFPSVIAAKKEAIKQLEYYRSMMNPKPAQTPLTDEQFDAAWTSFLNDAEYAELRKTLSIHQVRSMFAGFVRAIERAHGITPLQAPQSAPASPEAP